MEKKQKTESKSITAKDNHSSKLSSSAGKLQKKKNGSEPKIYGTSGGKGG
ncbi:hypothetical protein SAMN05421813_10310 [Daejeonella rubra]|uniref:Uncharacterized protein n=1 Tax=Daejeonella rubra TaxID=990371 RepID=A0A1G9NF17_9SPHI|nr:hypothetical protein [Daejeonella rubra]SDL85102.1 hypothetical protein SAMN05421813_10310 [Daejeonella rubra]